MDKTPVLAGRYRLEARLGGGGMSVVWRAYDEVRGRPVAVKVVAPRHADEATARERIRTEARAAKQVNHSRITKILDYSDSAESPYLVMELLEGQTLAQRMQAGRLPIRTALEICAQVADALAAAHASGVVHRDVKPGNVMLTPDGATILDLGIAAFVEESGESGMSAGSGSARWDGAVPEDRIWATAAYVAPERLTKRRVLPASDMYALGVLLYRALTGRRPWPAAGRAEMLAAHVSIDPAPLPPDIGVPPEVAALCYRCLSKDPLQRPTAEEVASSLTAAAAVAVRPARSLDTPTTVAMADAASGPDRRQPRRHAATRARKGLRLAVVAGASTLLAAAGAALIAYSVTDDYRPQEAIAAAPPLPGPSASGPAESPPGSRPPTSTAAPARSPDDASGLPGTFGQADSTSGPGSVQVVTSTSSGGRGKAYGRGANGGNRPSPKSRPTPRAKPKPTPNPTPLPTTSPTSPGIVHGRK